MAFGRRLERGEIAAPPLAEAKIASDRERARPKAAHEHFIDEALGAKSGEPRIEPRHVHAADAPGGHQLELVAQAAQARRRRALGEKLAGMRFESKHTGADVQFAGPRVDPVQQRAMPEVHSVEIPDRHGPAACGRRASRQETVRDNHESAVKMLIIVAFGAALAMQFARLSGEDQ